MPVHLVLYNFGTSSVSTFRQFSRIGQELDNKSVAQTNKQNLQNYQLQQNYRISQHSNHFRKNSRKSNKHNSSLYADFFSCRFLVSFFQPQNGSPSSPTSGTFGAWSYRLFALAALSFFSKVWNFSTTTSVT